MSDSISPVWFSLLLWLSVRAGCANRSAAALVRCWWWWLLTKLWPLRSPFAWWARACCCRYCWWCSAAKWAGEVGECAGRRSGEVLRFVAEMCRSVCSRAADGDLGRVSASKEATLKLLILLLALGCGGTVGLVMAVVRSGVTVIPDDFSMNCVEFLG